MKCVHRGFSPVLATILGLAIAAILPLSASGQTPLTFSQSIAPSTIGPGSVSTVSFVVVNNTASTVRELAFTDDLPTGVSIADPAKATSTCLGTLTAPAGGGTLALADGGLGIGGSCSITVDVTSATPGTHTNLTGELTSDAGSGGTSSADLTVATDRPGFTKSFSPGTVVFGGRSTLTLTIDNTANSQTELSLRFTDDLPDGMVIADPANASTTCTGGVLSAVAGDDSISYASGSVTAGASCTVSVDVLGNATGELGNTTGELASTSSGPLTSSGKAAATLTVTIESISLTKAFAGDPVAPGGSVSLEFTVRNLDRRSAATDIAFTDDLDGALSGLAATDLPLTDVCGSGSSLAGTGVISLTGGSLGVEGSCTFSVTLAVPAGAAAGDYSSTTSSITATVDSGPVVGSPASDILFVSPVPLLSKEFTDDPVAAGDSVTLAFTITNGSSTSSASDIAFIDELTTFLPFPVTATLPADGFCGAGSNLSLISPDTDRQALSLTGGSLAGGASCNFDATIDIATDVASGSYTNTTGEITATVDGATVTGDPASDDLVVVGGPQLIKEFPGGPTPAGSTATLEFTVIHDANATADATGITFTDDLQAALDGLVSTSGTVNDVCGTGSQVGGSSLLTLSGGTLAPGVSCTFGVDVQVPATAAPGDYTNNTSALQSTVAGLSLTGNVATADLSVAGLTIAKELTDDPVPAGGSANLRFTITNTSLSSDATNIVFTDNLDDMLDGAVSSSGTQSNVCGAGSQITGTTSLTFTGGALAAGESCSFDVTVEVPGTAEDDTFTNVTSSLTATIDGGSTVVFDPAVADLEVQSRLLQLTKEFIADPTAPGDDVTLHFEITNLGTEPLALITFTDDLDAVLSGLASTSGTLSVCGGEISGTGLLTFSGGSLAASASCSFDVTVAVPASAPLGTVATNTTSEIVGGIDKGLYVLKAGIFGDPASDELRIGALELTKSFVPGSVEVGGTGSLRFTIVNQSSATASDIAFSDDLDAALSGLAASSLPAAGFCGPGSEVAGASFLSATVGTLLPSGSCTFDVEVTVPIDAEPGTYLNTTSEISASNFGGTGDPASASLTVFVPSDCPDRASIDYGGYTAASCATQNPVNVFNQAELNAYMVDFGFDGNKVHNVRVKFDPSGDVTIISPCEILLRGESSGLALDTAGNVCLFGRKGVEVGSDSNNETLTAQTLGVVSEEGSALVKQQVTVDVDQLSMVAEKEVKIGLNCDLVVDGSMSLVSEGDLASSDAVIRQNSVVSADSILVSASRTAKLGISTEISAAGTLDLISTGSASGSLATIEQNADVDAGTFNQTSGNKVKVGLGTTVDVVGNYHLNADGSCTIKSTAQINAGSTSGNCFP